MKKKRHDKEKFPKTQKLRPVLEFPETMMQGIEKKNKQNY